MSSSPPTVRHATEADIDAVLRLIGDLASYEDATSQMRMTAPILRSTLSFPIPDSDVQAFTPGHARCLLVFPPDSADAVGMAFYYISYSTWTGPGIWLEDQYVVPEWRRKGYGKAMLKELAREVGNVNPSGMGRLEWEALRWNELAIRFYEGEGVERERESAYVGFRAEGETLAMLAGGGGDVTGAGDSL